jgi:hypothetical protein
MQTKIIDHKQTSESEKRTSLPRSILDWQRLVRLILNNEVKKLPDTLHSNACRSITITEYTIEESERIYQISFLHHVCVPTKETIHSIIFASRSLVYYSIITNRMTSPCLVPLQAQWAFIRKISQVEDQIEQQANKFSTQKRVTSNVHRNLSSVEFVFLD